MLIYSTYIYLFTGSDSPMSDNSDMRWVDWEFIDENEDYFPGVHESFRMNRVNTFVGQKLTKWNDEMVMQFYSTAHFYPNGKIVWMTEGRRYQSSIAEWA